MLGVMTFTSPKTKSVWSFNAAAINRGIATTHADCQIQERALFTAMASMYGISLDEYEIRSGFGTHSIDNVLFFIHVAEEKLMMNQYVAAR